MEELFYSFAGKIIFWDLLKDQFDIIKQLIDILKVENNNWSSIILFDVRDGFLLLLYLLTLCFVVLLMEVIHIKVVKLMAKLLFKINQ